MAPSEEALPPEPGWTRGERLAFASILLLALALRCAYVLQSRASPFFEAPQMDALYHLEWARAFAQGQRFQEPPFFRAPLYPWFLGCVLRLTGDGLLAPRLVQALLGTATTALVYLIGRRSFGRAVALGAGLLAATSWVAIFHEGELLLESLAVPLYTLGLWLSLGLASRPTRLRSACTGLVWGLGAITRPNVLAFLPLLAAWLWLRARRVQEPRPWLAPALLLAGVALPIAPISAWNLLAGGNAVLIASQGGVNLWIGNNPHSDGTSAIVPGTREDWWGGYHDAIALAERAEGRPLAPSGVSRHYTRRALEWMGAEPGAWLALMARKLRLLWSDWELGNNEEPRFLALRFAPWLRLSPWSFGWVAPLAVLGWLGARRRWSELFPLWGFVAVYAAGILLFFVNARFRLPLLPGIAVLAAGGGLWLWQAVRAGRWKHLLAAATLVTLLAAAAYALPAGLRARAQANGWLQLGQAEGRAGRLQRAEELLLRSLEADPHGSIAWRDLGFARRGQGDAEGAEAALERALELRADDALALEQLCDLLITQGRVEEAAACARKAIASAPHAAAGHYDLGRARLAAGAPREAAEAFREVLRIQRGHFGAAYGLGRIASATGNTAEAIAALREAVASGRQAPPAMLLDAYRRLVQLLTGSGELESARQVAQAGLERFPGDPILEQAAGR